MGEDLLVHRNDVILVEEDTSPSQATLPGMEPWRILIVDDDDEVHKATRFALKGANIDDRQIQLLHAYSATEGEAILRNQPDIACVLLDVVMDTPDAGLGLVARIRGPMGNRLVRIILRTGQPGQAPELEVVQRYDVNDYKHKAELSNICLLTTLTASCRSYEQLKAIEAHRRGLSMIVEATRNLMQETGLQRLAAGVLTQICSLLDVPTEGAVCLGQSGVAGQPLKVLAAAGRFDSVGGRAVEDIPETAMREFLRTRFAERTDHSRQGTADLYAKLPSGDEVLVHVEHARPLSDLERRLLEVFSANITVALRNADLFEQVQDLAFRDRLTRLPNRLSFDQEIVRRIAAGQQFMVAVADMDHFHTVNSGLGHSFGDKILIEAGRVLARAARNMDGYVARLYSDAFGLVLPAADEAAGEAALAKIHTALHGPLKISGHKIYSSVSLGGALYPRDGDTEQLLFRRADMALRNAKTEGRGGSAFYAKGMGELQRERLAMVSQLNEAFAAGQLRLYFQPQVRLDSGRYIGGEALLRWPTNDGGFISPTEFIAAAEDSGLIHDIGDWVLEETCRWLRRWSDSCRGGPRLAFNISPVQFRHPGFAERLVKRISGAGVDPSLLELEITESTLFHDSDLIATQLRDFRSIGMRVAVDDFGTGYSSLSRLKMLPIDTLKIDRSFVVDMTESPENHSIAEAVVRIGHLLGKEVVAEGVETVAQAECLRAIGCEFGQGFLFSPAVPPEKFAEMLE